MQEHSTFVDRSNKKGLEDAAQLWLDRGGDRLVEEVNELYKADK